MAFEVAFVVALEAALGNQRRDVAVEIRYGDTACLSNERPNKTYDDHLSNIEHYFTAIC